MFSERLSFGGASLHLYGETPWQLSPLCAPFRTDAETPAHEIHVRLADDMPTTPDTAASSFRTYRWRTGAQRHTLQDYGVGFTYAVTEGGFTELTVSSRYAENLRTQLLLEGVDLFDILAERGMLVLHSAYIVARTGEAILFSGPSGVGKSTQAALWECCAGARVVNGDRALVDVTKKTANGIFYSGTSGISENVTAPVRAIVLLGQSSENRVFGPSPQAAFAGVLSQCAYYEWDARSAEQMTECVARLVSDVPVLRMDCLPDATAVEALRGKLGGI